MAEHPYNQAIRGLDLPRLPLHLRRQSRQSLQLGDKSADADGHQSRKRFPESLHFNPSAFRLRSRTESTRSSISSAHIPDSATTYSVSTLASPISSGYASDLQERFAVHTIDSSSRPCSRIRHRHQPSTATTCSTYINDDNEASLVVEYSDIASKLRELHDDCPEPGVPGQTATANPLTEPFVKEEEDLSQFPCNSPAPRSDTTSIASDDFSTDDADALLDYTLQLVYGIELRDASVSTPVLRQLVSKYIRDLGQHIWQTTSDTQVNAQTMSTSSSSTPSQGAGREGSQGFGKRKKQTGGDDGGEDFSDGECSGFGPAKRPRPSPKEEENLRLSCPFRKRNAHRFNVRDHHSCAMTYFPKFAELRQHIVKQHKRDDPSAFVCDRCTRDFRSRKELRDHQRLPKEQMCDISDHDPESGIDGPTAVKLVSRKRASGTSAEVQWREIWNILFPDDDDQMIQPYRKTPAILCLPVQRLTDCTEFTPVIEHFELSSQYLAAFDFLQTSLRNKISNPATLETLATKFHQCFIEAMESCSAVARTMPYTNRRNKKNEPTRVQSTQPPNPRKLRAVTSRPDSGVVMDDGSEESGSVLGASALGHRDSVRTVKGLVPRRESNLAPTALREVPREVLPAPAVPSTMDGGYAGQLSSLPLGITPAGLDPAAAVQVWNNGVTFEQEDTRFSMPEQWMAAGSLTPQAEFTHGAMDESFLYHTDFSTIGDGFSGFNGR
ncbi:hypothetical protein TOPH_04623 [Tolypocladium ophioglossoides CBS 100239]|uniref:C2H2-type domain-containing protein n=1 Tax=Tolypocladium ophioglossoides (strain CBS 100239) TaxID=1163406 RepID=A0A0L0N9R0_TOLOC|nr:hypothetical protein TOPH_04623 [Tolypocladium ophioglossoides CBS 100239]